VKETDHMTPLRILFVEDNPLDTELAVRELEKNGYELEWQRVDTEAEFTSRLAHNPPDLVISDHAMPQFSSSEALRCLHNSGLTIPFIVVSQAIGEEEAVKLMRAGAADYLLKDRMARLGEAVHHALDKQQLRLQYAESQRGLSRLNQELETRIAERTAELEVVNDALARELAERKQIEEQLRQLTGTLEERVKERTQELAISYSRLRALATDLTVAEQRERRRLATELHDYLAQILVVTRMKVAQLQKQNPDGEMGIVLRETDQLLHQSLDYTRSLVSELTPQALYERGLGAALQWLGDQMSRQQILKVVVSLEVPQLPLPETDAVLLFQSIRELLFNVFKHGMTDQAFVSMGHAQNTLTITVSDHGCGFDISRLKKDRSDRFGLFSIRERMMALGGAFDVQSVPGKGTVASLQLPYPMPGGQINGAELTAEQGRIPTKHAALRVLIVDDHQMFREGLCCIFEEYDDLTVVGEASTGEQALQLVGMLQPDVVMMDMHMPGWDGAESTRRILREYPATVVIGLSIQPDPDVTKSMREAGVAAFLPKETIGNELYATIQTAVNREASRSRCP